MVIAHNISAINTYKSLGIAGNFADKAMEKLSSGYKINKAADDAAGLSISEKMRSQIRGLNQASENAENGISLIQTAEGALNEVHSILQRMRELAVQSATDTNASEDREALQGEIDQLIEEVNRIGNTTEFNGIKLFGGDTKPLEASSDITSALTSKLSELGLSAGSVSANADNSYTFSFSDLSNGSTIQIGSNTYTIGSGKKVELSSSADRKFYKTSDNSVVTDSDLAKYDSIQDAISSGDLYKYDGETSRFVLASDGDEGFGYNKTFTWTITDGSGAEVAKFQRVVDGSGNKTDSLLSGHLYNANGEELTYNDSSKDTYYQKHMCFYHQDHPEKPYILTSVPSGTYDVTNRPGTFVVMTINGSTFPQKPVYLHIQKTSLSASDLKETSLTEDPSKPFKTKSAILNEVDSKFDGLKEITVGEKDYSVRVKQTGDTFTLKVREKGNEVSELNFHVGANSNQVIRAELEAMNSEELEIADIDVLSRDSANEAIDTVDSAIKMVSNMRSRFGAIQNRLEYTINNLNTTAENMTASESTIRDVDMADEMMEYTKNNILQQAAQAMLVQSNSRPQMALQLLG